MSAQTTAKPNPAWAGNATIDLIHAADQDEMTAVDVANHPHATSEDFEMAAFLLDRAAEMRAEIARRTR